MLNHDLKHLKEIKNNIIHKTIEEQAAYADLICIESINDPDFIRSQMDSVKVNDPEMFENFNTTSIGNLAYLILHAGEKDSNKAKQILQNYKEYIKQKNHS